MKYLVTGGAGFIGSNLSDKLIELGHGVVVIDNLSNGKREYLNPKAKFYCADICSGEIQEIFKNEKFDYVFHLAAQIDVRASIEDPESDNRINILGGINILKNCREHKVKKIIFSSTGGAIYGEAPVPTTEAYPPNPISPYGIHKLAFEKYLNYYHKVFGQNYAVLRFANVYGPRQYKGGEAGVIAIFIDRIASNKELFVNGDGMQTRDFVFVNDIVRALIKAAENDYCGAVNISTGVESNLLEVITAIEKILGKKVPFGFRDAVIGEQRRSCLDFSLAEKVLSWRPETALEEGIRETIKWAQNKS